MKINNSNKLKEKAEKIIPHFTGTFSSAPTNFIEGVYPVYAEHANGCRFWDVDGNEFIDYGMGNGACFLGHSDPDVLEAVKKTSVDGLHFGHDHPAQVEWADLIQKMIPSA